MSNLQIVDSHLHIMEFPHLTIWLVTFLPFYAPGSCVEDSLKEFHSTSTQLARLQRALQMHAACRETIALQTELSGCNYEEQLQIIKHS